MNEAAAIRVAAEAAVDYEEKADEYWDTFYGIHQNRFFKEKINQSSNFYFSPKANLFDKSLELEALTNEK